MIDHTVEFRYLRSTGPALERFFDGLARQEIWGRACDECNHVVVPARDFCDTCGSALGEWIKTGPEGVVTGLTVVHADSPLVQPAPPFAVVRVRLDGAGTDLVHLAPDPIGIARGTRVRPVWAPEPSGTIRDITGFEAIP